MYLFAWLSKTEKVQVFLLLVMAILVVVEVAQVAIENIRKKELDKNIEPIPTKPTPQTGTISNTRQLLGIIGSALLVLGSFVPIVHIPIVGDVNYFQNGKGDGVIVLILAGISLLLTLRKKFKGLYFTGLASMGLVVFAFISFQMKMSELQSELNNKLAGNFFKGLSDLTLQSIQLQWGWAVLVIGIFLILAAAGLKED